MQAYKEYKETGLAWLERIPKHWRVVRNKNFLTEITLKNEDEQANLLGVSQYTGVTEKKNATNMQGSKKSESLVGYKCVKEHQLVINIMLTWNGSLGISKYTGVVSPAYAVFSIADEVNPWFIHYLFRCPHLTKYFKAYSTGVIESRLRLYPETLFLLFSILPPREEQDSIVQFLDHKLEKIHKFIATKQKLIALLEEQKQAIINQAVTKGLDPNAPMKDSGIDWLGEVPQHWDFSKLKKLTERIGDGLHGTPVYDELGEYYFINGNNLKDKRIVITDKTQCVSKDEYEKHVKTFVEPTLLISLNGTIGNLAFYNNEKVCLGKSAGYLSGIKNIDKEYLYYYLQTSVVKNIFDLSFAGTTINNLSLSTLRELFTLVPPRSEQEKIVQFLNNKLFIIHDIIAKYQKEIDLIQEYKTSLISSVVTGQVDVGT